MFSKASLQKAFAYSSTYFTLVQQCSQHITGFVVESKEAKLGRRKPQMTEWDDCTDFNKGILEQLAKDELASSYYQNPIEHEAGENFPSPYLRSCCCLCFSSIKPNRDLQ